MTRQTFFNLAALELVALLVRHPTPVWFLMKAPTLSMKVAEFSLAGTTVSGAVCWRSERHQ